MRLKIQGIFCSIGFVKETKLKIKTMFKSYLLTAFRNIKRQKMYAAINIFGLALGMAVCLLAYLYIADELGYDEWYKDSDRIYRLTGKFVEEGAAEEIAVTPWPLGATLAKNLPEVEASTLISDAWTAILFSVGKKEVYIKKYARADSSFFDVFDQKLLAGNPQTAFSEPRNILLSKKLAEQFFGNAEAAFGKTIGITGSSEKKDYQVSGVLDTPGGRSHFEFDAYLPHWKKDFELNEWTSMFNYYSYLKMRPNVNMEEFIEKGGKVISKELAFAYQTNGNAEVNSETAMQDFGIGFGMQPITSIHLDSHLDGEIRTNGDRRYIYVYALIALVIMLIAVINFMNIATARSSKRAKEVGVRKVIGASRWHSTWQFLTESIVQSVVALILAILLAELMLPFFNGVLDKELVVFGSRFPMLLSIGVLFALGIGVLAGSYPAFFMSGFEPIRVLKGDFSRSGESVSLRKGLVIIQFTACAALLLFLFTVVRQINFMHNKELGFQAEQIIVVPIQTNNLKKDFSPLKNRLLQNPDIVNISQTLKVPGQQMGGNMYQSKAGIKDILDFNRVDHEYLNVLNIELKNGRNFREGDFNDTLTQYMVNETFVKQFQLGENPIGEQLLWDDGSLAGTIVGVFEDYHWKGFTENIQPHVLQERNDWTGQVAIKVKTDDVQNTLQFIRNEWEVMEPGRPMKYSFLDEDFAQLYEEYTNFGKSLSYLTLLIIFTAILGLFGLASYMAEQRIKEIGIRKVLGANTEQILFLLIKDFAKLVLIAGILAIPIGFLLSKKWLADFAYRISTEIWVFPVAILSVLLIAVLTVSVQAYRASRANPVDSLSYE
ncbi:MAG: putative ABC transport system permease protein [Paraglaciecola sp.]